MADVPEPSPPSRFSCLLTAWCIDKGLSVMPLESLLGVSTLHSTANSGANIASGLLIRFTHVGTLIQRE